MISNIAKQLTKACKLSNNCFAIFECLFIVLFIGVFYQFALIN